MPPKPSRSANLPPGRGRAPAPWTIWELMAIAVSVLMIVVPLTLEALNWLRPPVAPAQGLMAVTETAASLEQRPPTFTPVNTATPVTATPVTATPVTPTAETATPVTPTAETATPVTATPVTPTAETATPVTATPVTATPVTATPVTATPVTATPVTPTAATATPTPVTATPAPTLTPSPTPGTTRVTKFASLTTVTPGQTFSYSLAVTTQSAGTLTVTLRDVLDPRLELVGASALAGTCVADQTVICTLNVSSLNPASVTLQVRVRSTTSEGVVIPNQATLEQGSLQIAVSNVVNVTVVGSTVPTSPATVTPVTPTLVATSTFTPTPSPTSLTTTPTSIVTPVATSTPPPLRTATTVPTASPRPPAPTSPPAPPVPTSPPVPPAPTVLPTEPPTPAPVATVAPRPTATPRPRPPAPPPTNTLPPTNTPPPTEPPAPAVFSEGDLLLRLASDWGSAYAGQDIVFTVVVGNTHPAQTISAVSLRSVLPSNLQVLSANANRGSDPVISGQTVTYTAPDLAPGERVQVTIATRIRPNVAAGTLLVVQAQASYSGLSRPVFSNISTVLVVGEQQALTATATATATLAPATSPTATATVGLTATATATTAPPSPTATVGAVIGGGASPTATVTPTPRAAGGQSGSQSGGQAPLPNTSAGIPFLGILLLGATLLTRTIRLHRARERI